MTAIQLFDGLLETLVYLASSFVLIVLGKIAYQLFNPRINVKHELVEKDNLAFAISHTGYFVGLLLAVAGVASGPSAGLLQDFINIGLYGFLGIVLLNVSIIINDKLILSRFVVKDVIIRNKNVGAGVAEAGISVSTGLIIFGSIYGDGGLLTAITYWALGLLILLVTRRIYNIITPYDIHEHIEKENVAVGVGFAGALIAIANLIRNALMHDFSTWGETFTLLGFDVVMGLICLPFARLVTDKILLPGRNLTDEIVNQEHPNIGASFLEAFSYIGGSMLICWAL